MYLVKLIYPAFEVRFDTGNGVSNSRYQSFVAEPIYPSIKDNISPNLLQQLRKSRADEEQAHTAARAEAAVRTKERREELMVARQH